MHNVEEISKASIRECTLSKLAAGKLDTLESLVNDVTSFIGV